MKDIREVGISQVEVEDVEVKGVELHMITAILAVPSDKKSILETFDVMIEALKATKVVYLSRKAREN